MSSQLKTAVVVDDSAIVAGLTIDDSDFTTPYGQVQSQLRSGQVAVSAADTHVKHLEDAVVGVSGKTKLTKQNTGGNESLAVDLDAASVPSGQVPTANGSGGWAWAATGGGGASPVDVNGTAGETLAERDYVYLDESAGTWFKVDIDASSSIKCGRFRGIVNESGGITSSSTGSVRLLGEVSGYTGLTAWSPVYASTTAGGITQTRPSPTSGGAQVAIIELGVAISTTNVVLLPPKPVQYMIRNNALANDTSLTIEHHSDAMGHTRTAKAYIGSSEAGVAVANYADTNQDADVALKGPTGAGGSVNSSQSGSGVPIGDNGGTEYQEAQSFTVPGTGLLSQFTFDLNANVGTPSGNFTWEIRDDASGPGSTILATGTITPTASSTNTVNIAAGSQPFLVTSTTYWLVLYAPAQGTNNRWLWKANLTGTYSNGQRAYSSNGGVTWTTDAADTQFTLTIDAVTSYDRLAQGFQIASSTTVQSVRLWLKKVGSPSGNLTVKIETDSSGDPSGTPVTDGTSDTVAVSSLAASYGWIDFTFSTAPSLSASTQYHIVLETTGTQSNTNYVEWGADSSSPSYADGEMKSEASSVWSAQSKDASFEVIASGTTFNEPAVIGRWSDGTRDVAVRYDDGLGGSGTINTTGKNVTGVTADVTLVVEVP